MNVPEGKFFPAVYDAIFDFSKEISKDIAEIAIDELMEDGFLKSIPAVGTLINVANFVGNVRNIFLTKHVLVFAQQLNNSTLSREEIKKHYEELEKNPKKKLQELEIILQTLSKNRKYIQDKILANFYSAYCNPDDADFKWSDFELMSQITEGLFVDDLVELHKIYEAKKLQNGEFDIYATVRLSNLGLVNYTIRDILLVYDNKPSETPREVTINKIGKTFWEYGMTGIGHYHGEWIL